MRQFIKDEDRGRGFDDPRRAGDGCEVIAGGI